MLFHLKLLIILFVIFTIGTPPLTKDSAEVIDKLYRDGIRTLVSVDDLVEAVVNTLDVNTLGNNIYIVENNFFLFFCEARKSSG